MGGGHALETSSLLLAFNLPGNITQEAFENIDTLKVVDEPRILRLAFL